MEDPRGKYDGDPCPNCGHPRKRGGLCFQCHAALVRLPKSDPNRPTSEMPILPICRSNSHSCVVSGDGTDRCGHCDTAYICQRCQHKGMRTKSMKPPYFVLVCPVCNWEKHIHWIEYDLKCPKCGRDDAFGTYTRTFERIIKCPGCGDIPRGEAA